MLLALNERSEYVRANLDCRKGKYYCPACRSPVFLRSGSKTIPHFAHQRDSACRVAAEAESLLHLSAKLQLYQWLQGQVKGLALECYFPKIKQRADLFFCHEGQDYALEFQHSPIPLELLDKRTKGYHRIGVVPIWIFDDTLLQETGAMQFELSSLLQRGIRFSGVLGFYRPQMKKFRLLTQLTPYGKSGFFGNEKYVSEADFSVLDLLMPKVESPQFYFEWQEKRRFHLLHSVRYGGLRAPFFRRLYASGYALHTLPAFVDVPLSKGYLIHTPALEWQGDLFLKLLQYEQVDWLMLQQIWLEMRRKNQVRLRVLPCLERSNEMSVLWSYLLLLERVGFLRKVAGSSYLIDKQVLEQVKESEVFSILNENPFCYTIG